MRDVLEHELGVDRAAEIIGRLSSVIDMRPFEFLRRTPPEQIVTFLRNEAPQTVALVVANLHTTHGAQVLSHLPESDQADIAVRIARMAETSPDVVKQVEQVMRKKLASVAQQDYSAAGGVKSLAEIRNHADAPPSATCSTPSPRPTRSSPPRCGVSCSCSRTSSSSTIARSSSSSARPTRRISPSHCAA